MTTSTQFPAHFLSTSGPFPSTSGPYIRSGLSASHIMMSLAVSSDAWRDSPPDRVTEVLQGERPASYRWQVKRFEVCKASRALWSVVTVKCFPTRQ